MISCFLCFSSSLWDSSVSETDINKAELKFLWDVCSTSCESAKSRQFIFVIHFPVPLVLAVKSIPCSDLSDLFRLGETRGRGERKRGSFLEIEIFGHLTRYSTNTSVCLLISLFLFLRNFRNRFKRVIAILMY